MHTLFAVDKLRPDHFDSNPNMLTTTSEQISMMALKVRLDLGIEYK